MRWIIDRPSGNLIPAANELGARGTSDTAFAARGGSIEPLELQVVDVDPATGVQVPILLPDGTVIKWIGKAVGKYTGAVVVSVLSFTRPATSAGYYTADLDTTGDDVLTALGDLDSDPANDADSLTVAGEITILLPAKSVPGRTQHVYVTIENYYSHDSDAGIELAPSPVFGSQRGTVAIANGSDLATVVFADAYSSPDWYATSLVIRNTADTNPEAIGILTMETQTATGFTLRLTGKAGTGNYVLVYACASIPDSATVLGDLDGGAAAGRVQKLQYRRGTAAAWTAANPILLAGEPGFESDTGKGKTGDGVTHWTALAYAGGGLPDTGAITITTLGTVATGAWHADVIAGQYGGTGVANTGKTLTLGGNVVTSGAYALALTLTGATNVTLPTTGALIADNGAGGIVLQSGGDSITLKNGGGTDVLHINNAGTITNGGLSSITSGPTHIFFGDFGNGQGIELKTQVGSISLWAANGIIPIGDVSSSFPALKRNSAGLEARLADDSGYTTFRASIFTGVGSGLTSVPGALTIDSGWTANADDGLRTNAIPSDATILGIYAWMTAAAGDAGDSVSVLRNLFSQVKALRAALRDLLSPSN